MKDEILDPQHCTICGDETNVAFNIKFRLTPICEACANAITSQQVADLIAKNRLLTNVKDSL